MAVLLKELQGRAGAAGGLSAQAVTAQVALKAREGLHIQASEPSDPGAAHIELSMRSELHAVGRVPVMRVSLNQLRGAATECSKLGAVCWQGTLAASSAPPTLPSTHRYFKSSISDHALGRVPANPVRAMDLQRQVGFSSSAGLSVWARVAVGSASRACA
jgi:hypothetical protein